MSSPSSHPPLLLSSPALEPSALRLHGEDACLARDTTPSYQGSARDLPARVSATRPPTPDTDAGRGLFRQPALYGAENMGYSGLSVEEATLYQGRNLYWQTLLGEINHALEEVNGAILPEATLEELRKRAQATLDATRSWNKVEHFLRRWPGHANPVLDAGAAAVHKCGQQAIDEIEPNRGRIKARELWFTEFQALSEMCHRVFPQDAQDSGRITQEPGLGMTSGSTDDITSMDSKTDDPQPTSNPPYSVPQCAGRDSAATQSPGSTSNSVSQRTGRNDDTTP